MKNKFFEQPFVPSKSRGTHDGVCETLTEELQVPGFMLPAWQKAIFCHICKTESAPHNAKEVFKVLYRFARLSSAEDIEYLIEEGFPELNAEGKLSDSQWTFIDEAFLSLAQRSDEDELACGWPFGIRQRKISQCPKI